MNTKQEISMKDFFALPEVVKQQEIQKRNPYGSAEHIEAFRQIRRIALRYGVEEHFNY